MTLNEFLFDSLETFESFKIDFGKYTKEMTNELYEMYEGHEINNYYLEIKNNKPYIIIALDF